VFAAIFPVRETGPRIQMECRKHQFAATNQTDRPSIAGCASGLPDPSCWEARCCRCRHSKRRWAPASANRALQLTVTGQANLRYVFEASLDLAQWTKIGVRTNLTGTAELTDSAAANVPQRFYRVLVP